MRSPERVLNSLSEHSKDASYKFERLYRILFNEEMFYVAYQRIYAKEGNMTKGSDGQTIDNMSLKRIEKLIDTLKDETYQPQPSKRVYIPKKNGKKRPLGVPTFNDKLIQEVVRMVLEAIYEGNFEYTSHGFRPNRSCHTALTHIQKEFNGAKWFVEGDIKGCFDHISHEWLLDNVRIDRHILRKWLKSGVVFIKLLLPTLEGTPQGGIISPTLANATLDGMERMLKKKYKVSYVNGKLYYPKVNLVRYADDFIVTADRRETLLEIKEMLTAFLKERGLTLSEEKTLITHISDGFDFLGFNVRNYNGTLLIKPSKKSQKRFTDKLHEVVLTKGKALSQQELIEKINPIIRGWGNYYCYVAPKEVFCRCDHILINQLKSWSYRRHTNKSRKWIRNKYFIRKGCRNWIFGFEYVCGGIEEKFTVQQLTEIPINRHIKIKCEANPFDPLWDDYFEKRKLKSSRLRA